MLLQPLKRKYITTLKSSSNDIVSLVEQHGFYSIRTITSPKGCKYYLKKKPSLSSLFSGAFSQIVQVTGTEEESHIAIKVEPHPLLVLAFLFYVFIASVLCFEAYQKADYTLVASFSMSILIVLFVLSLFVIFELKYTEQRLREIFSDIKSV